MRDPFDGTYDEFMTGRGQKRLEKRVMMEIGWICIYLVLYTTVTAVLPGRGLGAVLSDSGILIHLQPNSSHLIALHLYK